MTRLGLTQRVEVVETYGERRDCLDQEWTTLLESAGFQPIPLPNCLTEPATYLDSLDLDGLILTSGNDLASLADPADPAPERDAFEAVALEYAIDAGLPVLGVCRGLEFLTVYFGGTLSPVEGHVAQEHGVSLEPADVPAIENLELPTELTVNSYHDFGIEPADVPDDLTIVGRAEDGTVECVAHDSHPIVSIMWHPERESSAAAFDRQLLSTLFGGDG